MAEQKRDGASSKDVQTLERGNVFFFYRPKVEQDQPDSIEDVQRFQIVMRPENKKLFRLGLTLHPEDETDRTAEIFTELKLDKQEHPLEPLFEGSWQ